MADQKSSLYPDTSELFSREYSANTGPPLHSDSYMQQQIDLLSGSGNRAPPPQTPPPPVLDVYGQSAYKQQQPLPYRPYAPAPMVMGPPHPSMVPRNQTSTVATAQVVTSQVLVAQPPPNLYNYKPSTPAPTPPVASPAQQQNAHASPRGPRANLGASMGGAANAASHNSSGGGGPMLMFQSDGPKSNGTPAKDNTLIDTSFMTPSAALPPVPPRVSQVGQDNSPAAFSGAPAPRPGEMLIPGVGAQTPAGGGSGAAPPPPVPPRSPLLQQKMKETGNDLLEFQKSPRVPAKAAKSASEALLDTTIHEAAPRDEWEIDQDELVFEKEIASGTFGSVWKGQYQRTPCAIKKLHGEKLSPKQLQEFQAEVSIMKKLRHPNVVLFMGFCSNRQTGEPMYMVFEYLERGSLWGIIHNKSVYITQPMRVKMAQDIARGLYYLHSLKPPILHRDIKSPNILCDGALSLKVADFGLSKTRQFLQETMTSGMGTYQYMAPEVIQGTDYSLKADVFSYGVVLWEILARLPPYQGIPGLTLAFKVVNEGLRPTIPPNCDASYAQLMQACWATNPELRPTMGFVLDALDLMAGQGDYKRDGKR